MKTVRKILQFLAAVAAVAAVVYCIAANWDKISDGVSSLLDRLGIGRDRDGDWDDYADWEE